MHRRPLLCHTSEKVAANVLLATALFQFICLKHLAQVSHTTRALIISSRLGISPME